MVTLAALLLLAVGVGSGRVGEPALARPPITPCCTGPLFATLLGENERERRRPDGRGAASVITSGDQLCIGLTVAGIDTPTAAHVHRYHAGADGPAIITVPAPDSGDPGTSSGCVTADADLLNEIRSQPSQFYVNVHTAEHPGGAIRGQLRRHPH